MATSGLNYTVIDNSDAIRYSERLFQQIQRPAVTLWKLHNRPIKHTTYNNIKKLHTKAGYNHPL